MPSGPAPRTILVVEDEPRLRELYRTVLVEAGLHVVAVSDGLDALQMIEAEQVPAAVVLDLALPRLSGRDVSQELRASARTRHIPIIIVTATDATDIEGIHVDCVLRKPFPPERLVQAVDACLRKWSAE